MRIGVVFPQTEMPADPGAVRAYVEAVADLGYTHVLAYDHVLGADPAVHEGWRGPYDIKSTFLEPLVLHAYIAALSQLELTTGVVVLPQRQTALVAKQAATLDVLCRGRLRLGVGIGWNEVEYEALGENFRNRGRRLEEQIALLRRFWTEPSVTFAGKYHRVTGAGLAPMPVQRPIPVWFGVFGDRRALERVGRVADGWMPILPPDERFDEARAVVEAAAIDAGRDPATIGLDGRVELATTSPDEAVARADAWRQRGATHLSLNTMRGDLATVDDHVAALQRAAADLGITARKESREKA